jgi:hypothetical protein
LKRTATLHPFMFSEAAGAIAASHGGSIVKMIGYGHLSLQIPVVAAATGEIIGSRSFRPMT